ncbi:class I SAM-dependent methyltransferase [Methylocystis parvus]|uniref:Class I SAM-dependent methyltransferase n=1 Tax=Methylocystis parvus TaxID=134 RepID=A0A6B8M488_9HYPH|nr:class I SAM-dependent methyltransferase [Methylocystis parvus]QGM97731.1 class I SAM-dependent methyltransferase [Methylocystis parvus]WBK01966.1 methyltransferase domain-containing protein [Methylocystis parvus OBBP]
MIPNGKALFNLQDDQQWLDLLIRSVTEPTIGGVEMPRFPHPDFQRKLVGSADGHALQEAYKFYKYFKAYSEALAMPLHPKTKALDFGCGWGRYTRMLWNDIDADSLYGVDVEPETLAVCKGVGSPGTFQRIDAQGPLPFDDNKFDLIIAYSVFSHLPKKLADYWMSELHRVARSGCVIAYTTEPRRFLDFILEIPSPPPTSWHHGLAKFKHMAPKLYQDFDENKFCYIPTSGGEGLDPNVYGDAIIPESYIRDVWGKYFKCFAYVDDPNQFWQAVVIGQKS